ncbi:MAG: hypothetical protein JKY86_02040 [Gammaproteobacteria bacterium]|nr:hypothetical protein [Gammaproteobacteria bacterium]
MFDLGGNLQCSIFLDASRISPTTDTIATYLAPLAVKGFIPYTFQEILPGNPGPLNRLGFQSLDKEWTINLTSQRIDIERNPVNDGKNLNDHVDFAKQVSNFFAEVLPLVNMKGHRISFSGNGLLGEMDEGELTDVYKKVINPIPLYARGAFEWDSRSARHVDVEFNGKQETCNIITMVNRVNGEIQNQDGTRDINRIQIKFDFNTIPDATESRFTQEDVAPFLEIGIDMITRLLGEVEDTYTKND